MLRPFFYSYNCASWRYKVYSSGWIQQTWLYRGLLFGRYGFPSVHRYTWAGSCTFVSLTSAWIQHTWPCWGNLCGRYGYPPVHRYTGAGSSREQHRSFRTSSPHWEWCTGRSGDVCCTNSSSIYSGIPRMMKHLIAFFFNQATSHEWICLNSFKFIYHTTVDHVYKKLSYCAIYNWLW